mmetsp:Transcript_27741/g.89230  ORF Transcript_27741/g.89230 Transcript_27741/m.89230 type:complete len:405 (+) Transcript_27741:43-1257(+)
MARIETDAIFRPHLRVCDRPPWLENALDQSADHQASHPKKSWSHNGQASGYWFGCAHAFDIVNKCLADADDTEEVALLDVGCGAGYFLREVEELGHKFGRQTYLHGVEHREACALDEFETLMAQRHHVRKPTASADFNIYEKVDLERLGSPESQTQELDFIRDDKRFDMIVCSWAALQLRDPFGLLLQLAPLLKVGGILLVNTFFAVIQAETELLKIGTAAGWQWSGRQMMSVQLPGCTLHSSGPPIDMEKWFHHDCVSILEDAATDSWDVCVEYPGDPNHNFFLDLPPAAFGAGSYAKSSRGVDVATRRLDTQAPFLLPIRYGFKLCETGRVYKAHDREDGNLNDESYSVLYCFGEAPTPRSMQDREKDRMRERKGERVNCVKRPAGDICQFCKVPKEDISSL